MKRRWRRYWREFVRLQRTLVTTRGGVVGLIVFGGVFGALGVELHQLQLIDSVTMRFMVYFVMAGAGTSFAFLFQHYCYAISMAHQDILTGLANRKSIISAFKKYQALASREDRRLAVIYMDLNFFKPINDQYGHDAGDELLKRIANLLQMTVRDSDIVARIGGDEFLVLMTGSVTPEGVKRCVERLRQALHKPIRLRSAGGVAVDASMSIGVAMYPDDSTDMNELAEIADQRMFEDKRAHHNDR